MNNFQNHSESMFQAAKYIGNRKDTSSGHFDLQGLIQLNVRIISIVYFGYIIGTVREQ